MYRVFRYSHWAGISDYTSRFRVAVTYVVIRQLELPGHCDLPDLQAGTPSPEVTGPFCRVPLTRLFRHAFAFSARGTCVGSRYGRRLPFHGLQEFVKLPHHAFFRFSPLRYSPELYAWTGRRSRLTYPEASGLSLQTDGTGILTCFPFGTLELRCTLGPTNPRLTNMAEET